MNSELLHLKNVNWIYDSDSGFISTKFSKVYKYEFVVAGVFFIFFNWVSMKANFIMIKSKEFQVL